MFHQFSLQYRTVTDRQTDGHTTFLYQYRASALLCWLTSDKNQLTLAQVIEWHDFFDSQCMYTIQCMRVLVVGVGAL